MRVGGVRCDGVPARDMCSSCVLACSYASCMQTSLLNVTAANLLARRYPTAPSDTVLPGCCLSRLFGSVLQANNGLEQWAVSASWVRHSAFWRMRYCAALFPSDSPVDKRLPLLTSDSLCSQVTARIDTAAVTMLTPQTTTDCNLAQMYKGSAWFPNYFALESLRFPGRHIRHQVSFLERTLSLHSDTALSPFPAGLCLLTGLWQ